MHRVRFNGFVGFHFFLHWLIFGKKLDPAFQTEEVPCKLNTGSEIIKEHKIQQIDLLKVDVEKSELDVFLSIQEPDWSKNQQVIV